MKWRDVKSTNLHSVRFADGKLAVRFLSGAEYHYDDVDRADFDEWMKASSTGGHFNSHIRTKYTGTKKDNWR